MHTVSNLDRNNFEGDTMLSHDAAAALIGIGARSLYRLRAVGAGPSFRRIGKHILYPRSAVLAYIASVTVQTTNKRGGAQSQPA